MRAYRVERGVDEVGGDAGDGWPDRVGETSLSIRVPAADPLVRTGSTGHVTVLYPFLHHSLIDRPAQAALAELLAGQREFTLGFREFGRWPGVLYLAPELADPVRALTKAVRERWPAAVPYRGIFGEGLDPHLTLAVHDAPGTPPGVHDALEAAARPALPLSVRVREVQLAVFDGAGWREAASYRLGV
ncbi:2'-5' RNA ligase family protein [Streptomyces sp. NPDC058045]|uniref:2'-5' RNA ligase family protein n=1 Tax=Streptomyces sp. NPDC058045 TaxID=3346311 RepID=UPI0036E102F4